MNYAIHRCLSLAVFLIIIMLAGCAGNPAPLEVEQKAPVKYDNVLSPEAEELVRQGIKYHDEGNYETALDYYKKAMNLAPDHPVIYYEMGYSHISMGDHETALEMAEKGIAKAKERSFEEVIPTLLDLKGSALDNLGRSNEAVDVYLEALNEYGVSNTFLYYNLGASYYRIEKRGEAAEALAQGLRINPNHAGSNYLLGKICMEDGKKTQAFYALCYFLLLEPNTDRAAQSYNTILYMLKPEEAIGVRNNGTFTASDMIIATAFTLDEANFRLSDAEKTRAKLLYIFTNLEEQKNSGKIGRSEGDELWWDFYSPFFYRIARSEYFTVFCRYMGLSADPDANTWIENGRDEIEGFFEWVNEF